MSASSFHGLLVLDKPPGLTSRDAVDRVQLWFPRGTRIGHAGTLDPLATGVLVVAVGQATRLIDFVQRMDKTYRVTIRLGFTSDTDDAEGTITPRGQATPPARAAVERCLAGFVGEVEQVPPAYSAAKVAGRRAYHLARRGDDVPLAPRRVTIHHIDLLGYDWPRLQLVVRCGKGTYIRSLARDLGERLGCGGYVEDLRRTRIGPFEDKDALALDTEARLARQRLLPLATAVGELPRCTLAEPDLRRLRQGQAVVLGRQADWPAGSEVAVFAADGALVAVARVTAEGSQLQPEKVLSIAADE
jgi:tRNA pseudouridine55 synthase